MVHQSACIFKKKLELLPLMVELVRMPRKGAVVTTADVDASNGNPYRKPSYSNSKCCRSCES
jgi:hypothetical protein